MEDDEQECFKSEQNVIVLFALFRVLRTVDFESKFRHLPRYNENQSPGAIASPRVFSSNYMKKPMIPTPLSATPMRCE